MKVFERWSKTKLSSWLICFLVISINDASLGSIAEEMKEQIDTHCARCHAENGEAVDSTGDWSNSSNLADYLDRESPKNSPIFLEVSEESMPEDGKMSDLEREKFLDVFLRWVSAGAPTFENRVTPNPIAQNQVWKAILDDLSKVDNPKDFRYVSIVHLFNQGFSESALDGWRQGIIKLLNSLSWRPGLVAPLFIDSGKLIIKIRLSSLGWDQNSWAALLGRYPYDTPPSLVDLVENGKRLGGQIPMVRGDWLVAHAGTPPLYFQLMELPEKVTQLESFLGIDLAKNIETGSVYRAGFADSGVSSHNRIIERSDTKTGYFWSSYDFRASIGGQNIFQRPLGPNLTRREIVIFPAKIGHECYEAINIFSSANATGVM